MEKVKYRKSLNEYEDVKRMQSYYFEQGEEKGFAKGEAKGKAEGRAEGKAEGRAEGRSVLSATFKQVVTLYAHSVLKRRCKDNNFF